MNEIDERFREYIRVVGRGEKRAKALSFDDARDAMGLILDGRADPEQRGAFLLACRIRGEDPVEMAGFVAAMQVRCAPWPGPGGQVDGPAISVGHPYDGREDTFIMGAGAALVAAAAGAKVVLHSGGSVPAKHAPGVAEVLKALDIKACLNPAQAVTFLQTHGFVHLDIRQFLPQWSSLLGVREKIGLRLPFSSAEKLLDPARTGNLIAGIAHGPYLAKMLGAMKHLGIKRGMIVQGLEGSCDLHPGHAARVAALASDSALESTDIAIDPVKLGILPGIDIRANGADPLASAALTHDALAMKHESAADAIALNAAVLLWRSGISDGIESGLTLARETIRSGKAAELLKNSAKAASVLSR